MHTPTQTQRTVPLAQLQHVLSFSLLNSCHGDVIDKVDNMIFLFCMLLSKVLWGTLTVNEALLNHISFNEKINHCSTGVAIVLHLVCSSLSAFPVLFLPDAPQQLLLWWWINHFFDKPLSLSVSPSSHTLKSKCEKSWRLHLPPPQTYRHTQINSALFSHRGRQSQLCSRGINVRKRGLITTDTWWVEKE